MWSLATVVAVSCSLVGFVPGRAHADVPVTSTPLGGLVSDVVVDGSSGYVFVALYYPGQVDVLDFDGNIVATIPDEFQARSMVVVGDKLYVGLPQIGTIDEIDIATLTRTRHLATGLPSFRNVVSAAGALWVAVGPPNVGLERVSTSDGSVTPYPNPMYAGTGAVLVSDPADTNTLIEYGASDSPSPVARLDLSTDPPSMPVSISESAPSGLASISNLAITPNGADFVAAAASPTPYVFEERSTSDLGATAVTYPANSYPTAVAFTTAAGGLFAGGMSEPSSASVEVYALNDATNPTATHDFGQGWVEPFGLAFSPNGNRLFAITGQSLQDDVFQVLTLSGDPPPPTSTPASTASTSSTAPPTSTTTTLTFPPTTTTTTTFPTTTTSTVPTVAAFDVTPRNVRFGSQRVGTYGQFETVTLHNRGTVPVRLSNLSITGRVTDYGGVTTCRLPTILTSGTTCQVRLVFDPTAVGQRTASLNVYAEFLSLQGRNTSSVIPQTVSLNGTGTEGYYLAGAHGEIGTFGDAAFYGGASRIHLAAPIISVATTPNGAGYWLLGRDGGIFGYGNAHFYGSTGATHLNKPIVAMTASRTGKGYRLVAADGGIFGYGDAHFYGSTAGFHLGSLVIGMAATPDDHGYWIVTANGAVYGFGDAHNYGGTTRVHLRATIVQISPTPTNHGYWLLTSNGQLFAFGDAHNYGTANGQHIVGMATTPDGHGYWETTTNGAVFSYGNAHSYGDIRNLGVTDVIAIAGTSPMLAANRIGR